MNARQSKMFRWGLGFILCAVSLGTGFRGVADGTEETRELVLHKGVEHVAPGKTADQKGVLVIPGAVENRTGSWVYIIVHVKLYDQQGKELTAGNAANKTEQAAPTLNVRVAPGELGIFTYIRDVAKIEGRYDHCALSAEWIVTDGGSVGEIADVKTRRAPPYLRVTGVFESTGTNVCKFPEAVVAGYDDTGKIYEAGATAVQDAAGNPVEELLPGKSGTFEMILDNQADMIKDVNVLAGCGY